MRRIKMGEIQELSFLFTISPTIGHWYHINFSPSPTDGILGFEMMIDLFIDF